MTSVIDRTLLKSIQGNASTKTSMMQSSGLGGEVKRNKQAHHGFKKLRKLFLENLQDGTKETIDLIAKELRRYSGLISSGHLDINEPLNVSESTFLHLAVFHQQLGIVSSLLKLGAEPNRRSAQGNTPLHFACERLGEANGKSIVKLLIQKGGDISLKNVTDESTPLDKAAEMNHRNFVEEIAAKAVVASDASATVLNDDAASTAPGSRRGSAQQKAAQQVHKRLVQWSKDGSDSDELIELLSANKTLIANGLVDVNSPLDSNESTLLHALVTVPGCFRAIEAMLQAGANPNSIDRKGNTPLHFLAASSELSDSIALTSLLLAAGADSSLRNFTEGKTAAQKTNDPALKELLQKSEQCSGENQIDAMMHQVIAESDSLENKMRYDMMYQEELMLAKLEAGGGRRKAGRMLKDALKQHQQKNELIAQHIDAQNDNLQAKLASIRSMAVVSRRAEQELARLTANATALHSAVGQQRNISDVQLLNRLKNGKHNKEIDLKTRDLLKSLPQLEDEYEQAKRRIRGAQSEAEAALFDKLRQGSKAEKTHDDVLKALAEINSNASALHSAIGQSRLQSNDALLAKLAAGSGLSSSDVSRQLEELYRQQGATINQLQNQQKRANASLADKLIAARNRRKQSSASDNERKSAAELLNNQVGQLFQHLDRKKEGKLNLQQLNQYHRELHGCCLRLSSADEALSALYPVTIDKFLSSQIQLHHRCKMETQFKFDFAFIDSDQDGLVRHSAAHILWKSATGESLAQLKATLDGNMLSTHCCREELQQLIMNAALAHH